MDKKYFMQKAIDEAYEGIADSEGGPFGAVIVKDGEIVGRGHNRVLKKKDPTCHGEMEAIRDACRNLGTFDLSGCEIFTSGEPCPMCRGAIQWARIKVCYHACNYDDTTKIGFDDKEFSGKPLVSKELNREAGLELYDDYMSMNAKRY